MTLFCRPKRPPIGIVGHKCIRYESTEVCLCRGHCPTSGDCERSSIWSPNDSLVTAFTAMSFELRFLSFVVYKWSAFQRDRSVITSTATISIPTVRLSDCQWHFQCQLLPIVTHICDLLALLSVPCCPHPRSHLPVAHHIGWSLVSFRAIASIFITKGWINFNSLFPVIVFFYHSV